ncbi:MAG TPA: ThuA domain-containing protein [Trueperaceae bacterium]
MKRALVFQGGWQGHDPAGSAALAVRSLEPEGFAVDVSATLEVLHDAGALAAYDLIVPVWTMGELSAEGERNLMRVVEAGTGLAGWHGGMGDAFRASLGYKMMVGGQFVAHPGDITRYTVRITAGDDPITQGLDDFELMSEQYYMHVDPSNEVLAETTFAGDAQPWLEGVVMPVAWRRRWGKGRVFYLSIGHAVAEFDVPQAATLLRRGLTWASR